jgi:predicted HTH domain antitoxin
VLETLVVEAYKAEYLTSAEVGRILGLSRFEVDAFLKHHQAYLPYSILDFNQDIETLNQLRQQQP